MNPNAYTAQQEDAAPPVTVLPCQRCWISIQLLDDEDQPLAREPYWIRLPDGQIREGTLNDEGRVRLEPIPCGICQVRFPRVDAPSMEVAGKHLDTDWIAIQLVDEDGQPVAGEAYAITLPDGKVVEGKTDGQGRARHYGIAKGQCKVKFMGIDGGEFLRSTQGGADGR